MFGVWSLHVGRMLGIGSESRLDSKLLAPFIPFIAFTQSCCDRERVGYCTNIGAGFDNKERNRHFVGCHGVLVDGKCKKRKREGKENEDSEKGKKQKSEVSWIRAVHGGCVDE